MQQNGSRFADNSGAQNIPEDFKYKNTNSPYKYKYYANNSTADYLCETFNALVYHTQAFPQPEVGMWTETIIKIQADEMSQDLPVQPVTPDVIPAPQAPSVTPAPSQTPPPPILLHQLPHK